MSVFDQWGRLGNDDCARNARDFNNRTIQHYNLLPEAAQRLPQCPDNKLRVPENMIEYQNMRFKVGYGTPDSCAIDLDPTLQSVKDGTTHSRCKQQLFSRVFQGVPNLRPGVVDPQDEIVILQGLSTSTLECSELLAKRELTEVQHDVFAPLIDTIKRTVQTDKTTVEPWTRGGEHTREYIHSEDFKKMCHFNQVQGRYAAPNQVGNY